MNTLFKNSRANRIVMPALAFAACAVALTSCDDVPQNERYIEVERPQIARKVLVQEFTGQGCINCPQGAALVHELQEQYPGSVIAVNLHPKNTQYTRPLGGMNLTSDIATVYYQYYKPSSLPSAVIDGAPAVSNVSLWTDAILTALEVEAPAELTLHTDYDHATRELTVTYNALFSKLYESPLAINIWVMENGLVGPQYSGSNIVMEYVHNHVARTSLTGDWGVTIADSFIPDQEFTDSFSITLDSEWVAENCQVIAFLQNPSKVVEQSAEADVINSDND
ncbi:MAG: Omp28 family outer membrane lipoprotein [Muribaculaceae bacterium]|nr:Omp28 family outer membrane lipoprotein [Muribaculaceae bacterium]